MIFSFLVGGGSENSFGVGLAVEASGGAPVVGSGVAFAVDAVEDEDDGGFVFPRRREGSSGTLRIRTLHGNLCWSFNLIN